MQSDLVAKLRGSGTKNAPKGNRGVYMSICDDAADAIEALTADNRMKDELLTAAVDDYNKALGEISRLRDALTTVRKRTRNARGAIESNQVVDKDVHGSLTWVLATIDAALTERTALEANHGRS